MIQQVTTGYNVNISYNRSDNIFKVPVVKSTDIFSKNCSFMGRGLKDIPKEELTEMLNDTLKTVLDVAQTFPGTDKIMNSAKQTAFDLLAQGAQKGGEFLVNHVDEILDTITKVLPVAEGFFRIVKNLITGDSIVKLKDAVCIIDNTINLSVKQLTAEIVSNITAKVGAAIGTSVQVGVGTGIGAAAGKATGYIGLLTVWSATRDYLVDMIEGMLKNSGDNGGGENGLKMKYIVQKVYSVFAEDMGECSEQTLEQIAKALGLPIETVRKIHMQSIKKRTVEQTSSTQNIKDIIDSVKPRQNMFDGFFNRNSNYRRY